MRLTNSIDAECLRDERAWRAYLTLMASIREKYTTSHVIGEVNGLIRTRCKLPESEWRAFWNVTADLLIQWRFEEHLVTFLAVAEPRTNAIARVGIVDAGLIHLARSKDAVVITQDARTLVPLAREQSVDCVLLERLLLLAL